MLSVDVDNPKAPQAAPLTKVPLGTLTLVFMTVACGIAQSFDPSGRIADQLGFHFNILSQQCERSLTQVLPVFTRSLTHVFPHGGWWHLIPNTTALFVFGAMAEQRLGAWRLMTLYFTSGVVGIICHAFVPPLPTEPVAGESLAISGLLGAYCALSCNDRVRSPRARYTLAVIELVAVVCVVAWILTRNIPWQPDRETSLLYHLLPMMIVWLLVRGFVAASKFIPGAANKAVNPSGESGGF